MGGSLGLLLVWAGVLGTALLLQAGVWFFVPTIGFGCYLAWTVFEVILNDEIEDAVRVTVLSTVSLVGGLAIAFACPGLGRLADATSASTTFLVWALVVLALAAGSIGLVLRRL